MSELMNRILENESTEFVVDNDMKAEWVLKKIREAKNDCQRFTDEYQRQMDFYKAQIETLNQQTKDEIERLESMLAPYFREREQAGFTKASKTQVKYDLPSGKLLMKKQEPDYSRDDKKVIEWLEKTDQGKFVKVEKKLDWAGLKRQVIVNGQNVVTKDGEIVPGVTVTERGEKFVVEVDLK